MTYLLGMVLGLTTGCGSSPPTPKSETALDANRDRGAFEGLVDPYARGGAAAGTCALRSVYFAFDSIELRQDSRDALAEAARCLTSREVAKDARTALVGMADPRGTEEYNLALGDRRARVAASYLAALGVDPARVEVRSLGEEQARGTDDAGWAQDRRVEVYP